ncbi:MAG: hypothetical protein BWZ03_00739 [bacterium ADurb.BinA186]|nr:MAG: hypothetical protein BWZ03_00739 [bacterium ADurb.BinA186]
MSSQAGLNHYIKQGEREVASFILRRGTATALFLLIEWAAEQSMLKLYVYQFLVGFSQQN